MKKILNMTPHEIVIYKQDDTYSDGRKFYLKDGASPVAVIPSAGVLTAKIEYERTGETEGIPLFRPVIEDCPNIPEADIVVVSALFANAAVALAKEGVDRLYTISQPVYASPDNPRPVGCLGLNKYLP